MSTARHRLELAARILEVIDARRKQEPDFGIAVEREILAAELSLLEAVTAGLAEASGEVIARIK
jgi:hypothetical protein